MDEYRERFIASIKAYNLNAQYKLSMAVGESCLNDENGVKGSISDWKMDADMDMYRMKDEFYKSNRLRKRACEKY